MIRTREGNELTQPDGRGHYDWRNDRYDVRVWSPILAVVFIVGVALVLAGVALGSGAPLADRAVFWLTGGICAAAAAPLMSVRLTITSSGVRLSSALLGLTLKSVPAEAIQSVDFGSVSVSEWGGWGVRFAQGSLAFILRGTDGVVVSLKDFTRVAFTIPANQFPHLAQTTAR